MSSMVIIAAVFAWVALVPALVVFFRWTRTSPRADARRPEDALPLQFGRRTH
jgi:hypothetical protein